MTTTDITITHERINDILLLLALTRNGEIKSVTILEFEGVRALASGLDDVRHASMSAIAGKNPGISNSLDLEVCQTLFLLIGLCSLTINNLF